MIRLFLISDEEIDHSETLLWSRVQEQRVENTAETRCVHGLALDSPCAMCYGEALGYRLVRVRA